MFLGRLWVVSYVINLIWEISHAPLYLHFRGGPITLAVLFYAAAVDATIITVLGWLVGRVRRRELRLPLLFFGGVIAALVIEWRALTTARWAYGPLMPVVPLLGTGWSPTLQLGLTGVAACLIVTAGKARRRTGVGGAPQLPW
ncbi:MAG: hypothetical protein Q7S23_06090 [bacterium]|nr:hypothetical protein [bacterium]